MAERPTIKELPVAERPRERLVRYGAAALADAELLAILLRTGHSSTHDSALDLARRLLAQRGGLRFLVSASLTELCMVQGIGPAKAVQIKAALEIGRRVAREEALRPHIRGAADAAAILVPELRDLDVEEFWAIFLTTKHDVIAVQRMSRGSLSEAPGGPRELLREALRHNAAAVIVGHNHPSGDPTPSGPDIELTRRLSQAGELLGVPLLDHIVVAGARWVSLKQRGLGFEG